MSKVTKVREKWEEKKEERKEKTSNLFCRCNQHKLETHRVSSVTHERPALGSPCPCTNFFSDIQAREGSSPSLAVRLYTYVERSISGQSHFLCKFTPTRRPSQGTLRLPRGMVYQPLGILSMVKEAIGLAGNGSSETMIQTMSL